MNNAQGAELPQFTKKNPATEREPLADELELVGDNPGRVRVLGLLEARVNGTVATIPSEMLHNQSFSGLSFVGVVASLRGPRGLPAACAWFNECCFDWFWVEVTEILSIKVRADPRFRGGALCVWMTTPFAEYVLTTAHPLFEDHWEPTLRLLNAPRCDEWPRRGIRPSWWPAESTHAWPYEQTVEEQYRVMEQEGSLAQLAQSLSLRPDPSPPVWHRLGPKGDPQLPGRPLHNLGQMTEWVLAPDTGLRKTQEPDDGGAEGSSSARGKGKGKRTMRGAGQGSKRNSKARLQ
ncbi:hypothetical protein FRC06_010829 [Ceratobasidium sp. 370]|nr:hypothetical protein FRC06_010829 [Ceratobasidium sp. 370]